MKRSELAKIIKEEFESVIKELETDFDLPADSQLPQELQGIDAKELKKAATQAFVNAEDDTVKDIIARNPELADFIVGKSGYKKGEFDPNKPLGSADRPVGYGGKRGEYEKSDAGHDSSSPGGVIDASTWNAKVKDVAGMDQIREMVKQELAKLKK